MYYLRILFLMLILCLLYGVIVLAKAQVSKNLQNSELDRVINRSMPSNNEVDYQSVAKFKTFSRKKQYRIGDLISIDIAILNKSKEPIYFLDLGIWGHILVKDTAGKEVEAGNYTHPLVGPKFNLVGSGEYDSSRFLYIIGCEDISKKYSYTYKSLEDDFNNNRFVNYGRGCIKINEPGKYLIKAEISNDFTENDQKTKTAVGTMESTPFEINVIE